MPRRWIIGAVIPAFGDVEVVGAVVVISGVFWSRPPGTFNPLPVGLKVVTI